MNVLRLTGRLCLCRGCGQHFNSLTAFDRHRIDGFSGRCCLSPDGMRQRGMNLNRLGFWVSEPMPERHIRASGPQRRADLATDPMATQGGECAARQATPDTAPQCQTGVS